MFDAGALLAALDALPTDGSAGDYGHHLVPGLVRDGDTVEHRLDGYWRDVGTIAAYHRAHLELLSSNPPLRLDDPHWPMLTGSIIGGPASVIDGADVTNSMLSPGSRIAGTVKRSVIGRNVTIEPGAVVERSIVLDDATIAAGAVVHDAIVDIGAMITADAPGDLDADSDITIHPTTPR